MNAFALAILSALALEFVLGVAASIVNLRALKLEPPPGLEGVYKPDEYRKSQEYTRATTRFQLVTSGFTLALLLAFWLVGGFNYLDQAVRGYGPIVSGLFYIGILSVAYSLLMLPFSVYSTFVLEERFGFNRTTPRLFLVDRAKGLAFSVLLGAPLLAGVLALFEYGGPYTWLYGWAAAVAFIVVMEVVAPIWIMPLFNKFTPLGPGELREAILGYARSVGYRVGGIFVIDSSKRSSKSNAFFTGFGPSKRIALFDTLVERHTTPEMVAVLAHEIGHYKKRHVPMGTAISILQVGLILFLLSVFLGSPGLYQAFYLEGQPIYAGLIFFGLLYTPVEMALSIGMRALSRRNEYEADRFSAETTGDPESLDRALRRLSADNLSNLAPHPFYVFLNYTHPPLAQRLEAIQRVRARQH